ncbi:F-box/FBD/LRR-repeat protein At1g13570-like [Rutidosis leptorrhynchoides]|uniref:F-box/FBD/LRR-repeat protein At1g13570-like n=1 Tax=Rutidosis leptorrhynchoides TaxID=125765 RepID=UPI003A9A10C5
MVQVIPDTEILWKYKLVNAIFHVLLLHSGPTILKFKLDVNKLGMETEFDQIILFLSRRINVKWLESLELLCCNFEPPLTFNGFNKLRKIDFEDVRVTAEVLQNFLSSCPLLEEVFLIAHEEEYVDENFINPVTFFQCVPLIHTLHISKYYMKYMAAGGMPDKLPTSLHLKDVGLGVCLMDRDVISSALCIIRSSPNLEQLSFLMYDNEKFPIKESSIKFVDLQDDLSLTLDHLTYFGIISFSNNVFERECVKLIMAKSPVLTLVRIELEDKVSVDEELKILRDMIYRPFSCASPSAKLLIKRPKTSS